MYHVDMRGDRRIRCGWVKNTEIYQRYHDEEWGVPVHDDRLHFEMLILEGAQAGLSWDTILAKREEYRRVFKNFDPAYVAHMSDDELEQALSNSGIVRNRLKIYSVRKNARVFLDIQKEFGSFDKYVWQYVGDDAPRRKNILGSIPTFTVESDTLSKDLKKRGMSFVGSTIMYAYMQAVGMVDDHMAGCWRYGVE